MVLSMATLMFSKTSKSLLLFTSSTLEPNRYYSNPLLWEAHGSEARIAAVRRYDGPKQLACIIVESVGPTGPEEEATILRLKELVSGRMFVGGYEQQRRVL